MSYMSHQPSQRRPLGEATQRVNNSQSKHPIIPSNNVPVTHHEDLIPNCSFHSSNHNFPEKKGNYFVKSHISTVIAQDRAIITEYQDSRATTLSSNSGSKLKYHIGPWKLGKTLGRGSSARVRLARHRFTGQEAAVKIVRKSSAHISQSSSLANFEREESILRSDDGGLRRMPVGIEREVAIMKLIQHPNILKLYDIWENRKEIYLCLEYVDNGELFDLIAENGKLEEVEAVGYFRQILSAVGYCHSFNICHRDLKPENILLTSTGQIKIADFGMAALHQAPGHQLSTSCGSPHYAAPELIKGDKYRGDMVDIWSLGVILYASLSGRLPFDVIGVSKEWLAPLLTKIKKGQYIMPANFSPEAKSLIRKMLQINPSDRITLSEIWRHPLLMKYRYLDKLRKDTFPLTPTAQACCGLRLLRHEVNSEIFRHLRSMWHTLSEKQLMEALLKEEPNDQKLFYVLLVKFRDTQLENYMPDLEYSASDYHHIKPFKLSKIYSTCQFPLSEKNNQIRTASRFTVISNASENKQNYVPQRNYSEKENRRGEINFYRHEKNMIKSGSLRNMTSMRKRSQEASHTVTHVKSKTQLPRKSKRVFVSRSSLASSTRSCKRARRVRALREKRGVKFNYPHRDSQCDVRSIPAESPLSQECRRYNNHIKAACIDNNVPCSEKRPSKPSSQILSIKYQSKSSERTPLANSFNTGQLSEDFQQQSISLAKDCDKAFNFSDESEIQSLNFQMSPPEISTPRMNPTLSTRDEQFLPKYLDMKIESLNLELLRVQKRAELVRKMNGVESIAYLDQLVSYVDQHIEPIFPNRSHSTRRVTSAPVDMSGVFLNRQLPSECENESRKTKSRNNSYTSITERDFDRLDQTLLNSGISCGSTDWITGSGTFTDEIKVVQPSSPYSPMDIPAPLSIRKVSPQSERLGSKVRENVGSGKQVDSNVGTGEHHWTGALTCTEHDHGDFGQPQNYDDPLLSSNAVIVKKKSKWFKKNAAAGGDVRLLEKESLSPNIPFDDNGSSYEKYPCFPHELKKKASFNLARIFKKRNSKPDLDFSNTNDCDYLDTIPHIQDPALDATSSSNDEELTSKENNRDRQVAPQRNWKKARRETVDLLRGWRRFGIEDIQVDKKRNIIFGKVGSENYLHIKNVTFTAEFMTVVEHGKRSVLSIARWTQEQGAASSLHKVVETLEKILKGRDLLVTEEKKRKMMVKTIKLFPETFE